MKVAGSLSQNAISRAVEILRKGGVIAYPTEAVFGFGCDPENRAAVERILKLKQRDQTQGLILVASSWEQLESLIEPIPPRQLQRVLSTWPGPYTWIFPAKPEVPYWITGNHRSVAVRVSDHPIVQTLCQQFGGPIVSTSANIHQSPPARDFRTVKLLFEKQVDSIVPGNVGNLRNPTEIRDAVSGERIR